MRVKVVFYQCPCSLSAALIYSILKTDHTYSLMNWECMHGYKCVKQMVICI